MLLGSLYTCMSANSGKFYIKICRTVLTTQFFNLYWSLIIIRILVPCKFWTRISLLKKCYFNIKMHEYMNILLSHALFLYKTCLKNAVNIKIFIKLYLIYSVERYWQRDLVISSCFCWLVQTCNKSRIFNFFYNTWFICIELPISHEW